MIVTVLITYSDLLHNDEYLQHRLIDLYKLAD